jgi:thioredoxin 1
MKMLQTVVREIETAKELEKIISESEKVMVCCGRMGPMCIPVYDEMEELENERPDIKFYSMSFDTPEAAPIKSAPMCRGFMGLPFTIYYRKCIIVKATTSIQNREQILAVLNEFLNQ